MNGKLNPIDIVVTWVDGSDPVWMVKKAQHTGVTKTEENTNVRYRDWDTLKYWFRGIEKFAPWVRYVYFITDNQKPEWLNIDHPKLKWVKHTDFIPAEYLPTFNSNTIEWNLHRIKGLSENFVYFNDDVFLIKETSPEDFFVNGVPCDYPRISPISNESYFLHMLVNNYLLMKRHFSVKNSFKQNPLKWLQAQKPGQLFKILMCHSSGLFLRVHNWHIQISYKKEFFQKLWDEEYEAIHNTCKNKVRTAEDVTSWCVREWQVLSNNFKFKKPIGKYFATSNISQNNEAINYITKQKGKTVCLNDTELEKNFEQHKQMIVDAFEKLFPEKSFFEMR